MVYRMAFGLTPRTFVADEGRNIIFDEGATVKEIYFISKGTVWAGFTKYKESLLKK